MNRPSGPNNIEDQWDPPVVKSLPKVLATVVEVAGLLRVPA